jgi:hypothetical protein
MMARRGERIRGPARQAPLSSSDSWRVWAPAFVLFLGAVVPMMLFGCRDGKKGPPYIEPEAANATIIVHPMWKAEFDVSLDGHFLGRISWLQPYNVLPGSHILSADGGSLKFTIRPGETLNIALRHTGGTYWDEDLHEWRTEGGGTEIRIFEP